MSLLRLLTAGKTLVGLKKLESRYRLPGDRALPEFGCKKNPFRATVVPEKADSPKAGPTVPEEQSRAQGVTSAETAIVEAPPQLGKPVVQGNNEAVTPSSDTKKESRPAQNQSKTADEPAVLPSGIRALLLWGRAKKRKAFGARASRAMVQAELSLDTVKVVRNDLTETDLEVVRVKREAAPISPGPGGESATQAGRIGARMEHVGRPAFWHRKTVT